MDWIFNNLYILLIVGGALASWLKNRADAKAEAESAEQRAREEMIRGLDEPRQQPRPMPRTPPPLARPSRQSPPPLVQPEPEWRQPPMEAANPYAIDGPPPGHDDDLQAKLAEIRRQQEAARQLASDAREKRLRANRQVTTPATCPRPPANSPTLRATLKDPRQSRRAIVLREILGPPVAMR